MDPVVEAMQSLGFVHTDCLSCEFFGQDYDEEKVCDVFFTFLFKSGFKICFCYFYI